MSILLGRAILFGSGLPRDIDTQRAIVQPRHQLIAPLLLAGGLLVAGCLHRFPAGSGGSAWQYRSQVELGHRWRACADD